jgi:sulfur dioxygenase
MIFRQLFDQDSYTYTYLLGDKPGGEAVLIDPVLDKVERYLQLLKELDLTLGKVADTHVHADHITAMGTLRDRTKCITVMGEEAGVDVVSMRVRDGDHIPFGDLALTALYTPGHTDDSYSFLIDNMIFTGDTLFIRGTGRTDFQHGSSKDQYASLFEKVLTLPDDTLVYPGHDYKGDTVSTIGEEKKHNPRLQVSGLEEYMDLMDNLNLANPKLMDVAVPANLKMGLSQLALEEKGWSFSCREAMTFIDNDEYIFADLRSNEERSVKGSLPKCIHTPYEKIDDLLSEGGSLNELVSSSSAKLIFYCAYGERSAMAVQTARDMGLEAWNLKGGMDEWRNLSGELEGSGI